MTTEHFKNGDLPSTGDGIPQVSDEDLARLGQYQLLRHDIVFSRVGSVDLNAEVKDAQVGWLFSGRVLRVRPDGSIDSTFMHYGLSTDQVRNSIIERAVGLTMASINTGILGDTAFVAPIDKAEQVMVGSFFSHLDNLITLHQRKHEQLATPVNQKWDFRGKLVSSTTSGSTRPHPKKKQARSFKPLTCCFAGRVNRIRTCDPLTPSQVRYQTAPSPVAAPWLFRTARVEMIAQHLVHATDNLCDS